GIFVVHIVNFLFSPFLPPFPLKNPMRRQFLVLTLHGVHSLSRQTRVISGFPGFTNTFASGEIHM
ncbi:MAG: hypothetical protein IKP22_12430, partial [Clostridia bacterium]|nr:hypothetical protein [Clostridia bacterium]